MLGQKSEFSGDGFLIDSEDARSSSQRVSGDEVDKNRSIEPAFELPEADRMGGLREGAFAVLAEKSSDCSGV